MTDLTDLGKKLNELDTTQQSIQNASEGIIDLAKREEDRIDDLVKLWKSLILQKSHKLPFLYLANDIIQNSFFLKLKLHEVMFEQLIDALPKVYLTGNTKIKNEIVRLIEIWEERQVYETEKLTNLRGLLKMNEEIDPSNPNFPDYLVNNKIKINPKIPDLSKDLDSLNRYKLTTATLAQDSAEIPKEELSNFLEQENKSREAMMKDCAELIKKEFLIFAKHTHYLLEVDKLLDKINSYKKLDSMQVD
jgi:hypothetical protein